MARCNRNLRRAIVGVSSPHAAAKWWPSRGRTMAVWRRRKRQVSDICSGGASGRSHRRWDVRFGYRRPCTSDTPARNLGSPKPVSCLPSRGCRQSGGRVTCWPESSAQRLGPARAGAAGTWRAGRGARTGRSPRSRSANSGRIRRSSWPPPSPATPCCRCRPWS